MLIANTGHGRNALRHAVRDAELVGRALLRCGFCATKQDRHMVLNQTGGFAAKDRFRMTSDRGAHVYVMPLE